MTKGYVYFIATECLTKVKIGMTTSDCPKARLEAIQVGSPQKLSVAHYIKCTDIDPRVVERDLHSIFSSYRLHGEWFEVCGSLSYFLDEAQNGGLHSEARTWKKSPRAWSFYSADGAPELASAMGSKTPEGNPYNSALYASKITKDPLKTENAALRTILMELIEQNTKMSAVIASFRRASEIMDSLESEFHEKSCADGFSAVARMMARDSDKNLEALEYAHSEMSEESHFYENALYHCIRDKK